MSSLLIILFPYFLPWKVIITSEVKNFFFVFKILLIQQIENENLMDKSQVINDVNNSAATEQDNTQDLRSNEELSASTLTQEVADEVSINSSNSSSSPRSVLPSPQKTTTDQVSSPFQEIHLGVVHQFDMEDVAQETINGEGSLDSMPQNIHPSADDPNVESHNSDLGHSQV